MFFPLEHTSYLTNTWPCFLFLIFFFKNEIPFFSGFGSGWLPEMHSCSVLLPNAELGTGKASGLLYSTNGVLGFRHLPQHYAALSQEASPGGRAASPGGAHLEESCLREHTLKSSACRSTPGIWWCSASLGWYSQPPETAASSSALTYLIQHSMTRALVCILQLVISEPKAWS